MTVHAPSKKIKPIRRTSRSSSYADPFPWSQLEITVQQQNVDAFLALVQTIDWSKCTPQEIGQTVKWALALEAPLLARRLSGQGIKYHPQNQELQEMARLLAPPAITMTQPTITPDVKANQEWLVLHRETYRNQWVALKDGELLAAADSFPSLLSQVGDVKGKGILMTKII